MGPLFESLAAQIEGAWRHQLPDLGLGRMAKASTPNMLLEHTVKLAAELQARKNTCSA